MSKASSYSSIERLRDGRPLEIRSVTPDDRTELLEAVARSSSETLYRRFFGDLTLKNLLNLSILLGTVTTLAFVFLTNETSAVFIYFCSGFSTMLATVATLTLAADSCPPHAEGFAFAVLMSIINLATALADNVGS